MKGSGRVELDMASNSTPLSPSLLSPRPEEFRIRFGLDVGGSLAKVIYFEPLEDAIPPSPHLAGKESDIARLTRFIDSHANASLQMPVDDPELRGVIRFLNFETKDLAQFIDLVILAELILPEEARTINATGGGAHKYESMLFEKLGVRLQKRDELASLVKGLNFLFDHVPDEVFWYNDKSTSQNKKVPVTNSSAQYPYLLVNIGSGVSILKVTGRDSHERVSGTSLGGGTFFGLARMLTGAKKFDDIMEMCRRGDNTKVDMLVGDIYGVRNQFKSKLTRMPSDDDIDPEESEEDNLYERLGLDESRIASFFGKIGSQRDVDERPDNADLSLSLLRMMSYNIGQIAYLNAVNHGLERIYFVGSFIRDSPLTMENITEAVDFWSAGSMHAFFVRHEGYFGALGAFLIREERIRRESMASPSPNMEALNLSGATLRKLDKGKDREPAE